jgi:hypothetical protein
MGSLSRVDVQAGPRGPGQTDAGETDLGGRDPGGQGRDRTSGHPARGEERAGPSDARFVPVTQAAIPGEVHDGPEVRVRVRLRPKDAAWRGANRPDGGGSTTLAVCLGAVWFSY